MKFKQYINELFDTKVDVEVVKERPNHCIYSFTIKGLKYKFSGEFMRDMNNIGEWQLMFVSDMGLGITGSGNALQVFAAVGKCIDMFLKKYKPERFAFTAKEESRKKLYLKMSKLITKKYPYVYRTEGEYKDDEVYIFTRK